MCQENSDNIKNNDQATTDKTQELMANHLMDEKIQFAKEKDCQILRTRIDNLEIKTAEKNRSWYKTFGGITGLIAIIMSLFSIGYSMLKDKSRDEESRKKEIRENINNMLVLAANAKKEADSLKIMPDIYVSNNEEISKQFEIYLNNIDAVHKLISNKLSSEAYNYIGYCYFHFSYRTNKAFEYYDNALKVAKDVFDSSNVYVYLSNNYYSKGLFFDTLKAREYLQKDIQTLRHESDARGYYYLIRDLANASYFESSINLNTAVMYINSAKYYLNDFKTNQYMYEDLRTYINQKIFYIETNYNITIDTLIKKI